MNWTGFGVYLYLSFLLGMPAVCLAAAGEAELPERCDDLFARLRAGPVLAEAAAENAVDAELLLALIAVESDCRKEARSPEGAVGLMQVKPETAQAVGVSNVAAESENIKAGAKYLGGLLRRFNGDVRLALAGYNTGDRYAAEKRHRLPPAVAKFAEQVLEVYTKLKNQSGR